MAMNSLKGVEMELNDCAFPTLAGVVLTDKPEVAFEGCDYALLVGSYFTLFFFKDLTFLKELNLEPKEWKEEIYF